MTTPRKLTRRMTEAVDAVRKLTARHGIPPTARELAADLGIYYASAASLVRRPAERGGPKTRRERVGRGASPAGVRPADSG